MYIFFFFNDTATTEIYTLSLHDALPILPSDVRKASGLPASSILNFGLGPGFGAEPQVRCAIDGSAEHFRTSGHGRIRSEEHTSELQSLAYLVCRLLLEKKKQNNACTAYN